MNFPDRDLRGPGPVLYEGYMNKKDIRGVIYFIAIQVLWTMNAVAFSLDPGRLYLSVDMNEKIHGDYTIINTETYPVKFQVEKKGNAPWMTIKDGEFILQPKSSRKISYDICVTNRDLKGEQLCRVTVSEFPVEDNGVVGASMGVRMNIPVYLFVKGTQKMDMKVTGFDCNGDFSRNTNAIIGNIGSKAVINNTGNIHFMCQPFLMIYKMGEGNKKELAATRTDPQPSLLFPSDQKKIELSYQGPLPAGDYQCQTFIYFKVDDDLKMAPEDSMNLNRCYSAVKRFRLNQNGDMLIEP
jgi:hypothetical protein